MIKTSILVTLLFSTLFSSEYINLGKFKNDHTLFIQKDISKLSEKFLSTKYVSNTLSNNAIDTSEENLIINFDALDCFTFIDTIEALKNATNQNSFVKNLINTRYKFGKISYQNRNHFFSDWISSNHMDDITCSLGQCQKTIKYLNQNEKYLKEIKTVRRQISYINIKDIDTTLLRTGDYIGIYTDKKALDVTHTGIIIKNKDKVLIRHASSLQKKIIDSDLYEYTQNKLGVIIYRGIN